jgi:hypothetical protein
VSETRAGFYFRIPNSLYESVSMLGHDVGVEKALAGLVRLCKRLHDADGEVERSVADRLLGSPALVEELVADGALIFTSERRVTTPLFVHISERREAKRAAALKGLGRVDDTTAVEETNKQTKKEKKKRLPADAGTCQQMLADASDSASPPSVPVDAGQVSQLALVPSDAPTASSRDDKKPFRAAQEALGEDFALLRAGSYVWQGAKDTQALKALLGASDLQEIRARWRCALQLQKWPACSTVAELASKWNHLAKVDVKFVAGESNVF